MNIFYIIKKILILISLSTLISCDYFDFYSIIGSESADKRFKENENYSNHPTPQIKDTNNFSFLVISDTHYYKNNWNFGKRLNVLRQQYNAEFLIVNGDISQSGREKEFNLFLNDMKNYDGIIYPVLGNHDVYNNGSQVFGKLLGKFIYSIDIENIRFIFLDTSTGTFGKKQKDWYQNKLSCNKKIIVFTHYNLITGIVQELTSMSNAEDEYYFFNINDEYNVEYVFSGHLHKNNKKEIRGVKYQTITTLQNKKDSVLLVSIRENTINTKLLNLPKE